MWKKLSLALFFIYVVIIILIDNFLDNGIFVNVCSIFLIFYSGFLIFYIWYKEGTFDDHIALMTIKVINVTFIIISFDYLCRINPLITQIMNTLNYTSICLFIPFVVVYLFLDGILFVNLWKRPPLEQQQEKKIIEKDDSESEESEENTEVNIIEIPTRDIIPKYNPTQQSDPFSNLTIGVVK